MYFYYMYFKNCNFGELLHIYIYWITICLAWSSVKKKNYENIKKYLQVFHNYLDFNKFSLNTCGHKVFPAPNS